MAHNIIFHSEDLQARSETRWDIPLAGTQGELDAWYPGGARVSAKVSAHVLKAMFGEMDSAKALLALDWPNDLDAIEGWAANAASHLARAYAIARFLEERGDRESAEAAVFLQSAIQSMHDESEDRVGLVEAGK